MAERWDAPVTCMGGAVVDRKLHLHGRAVAGTSNPARMVRSDGGVARNVAETLARLGVPAALVSQVGDDEEGRGVVARLRAAGVDTAGVVAVRGGTTAEYVAVLDGGELVIAAAAMEVLDGIGTGDVDRAWPAGRPGWVFLDCNCPAEVIAHALARARAEGVPTAVDAVSVPKVRRLPDDLTGLSVLFCNRAEAEAVMSWYGAAGSARTDSDLAGALLAAGAEGVVLTDGVAGLVVAGSGGVRLVPSVPAVPVDTTGAGDALVGGTLAGLAAGATLADAAAVGSAAAALTLESEYTVRPDLSRDLVDRAMAERRAPTTATGQAR